MKVLITGGHFSPAYSIISELKTRGQSVVIAGRKHPFEGDDSYSFEYLVAEKQNLPFYEIKTGRYQRKFTSYTLSSLLKTPIGLLKALAILKSSKPDVVMTFGGYIGLPISIAAALLRIPVILHEQTQGAGLASRIIGRFAKKICISFDGSRKFFDSQKTVHTGNPIRKEIFEIRDKFDLAKGKKVIYVTGGSTGSHFINSLLVHIASKLLDDFIIIHQTGESSRSQDFETLTRLRDGLPDARKKSYILRKFIYPEQIGFVLKVSDLILTRAGANIVSEILVVKKMSLLIPLPHGQASEQLENAKFVSSLGIGEYIEEKDAAPNVILDKIRSMLKNEKKYAFNMRKAKDFVNPDAAKRIVDLIEEII